MDQLETKYFNIYVDFMLKNNDKENLGLTIETIVDQWNLHYKNIFMNYSTHK